MKAGPQTFEVGFYVCSHICRCKDVFLKSEKLSVVDPGVGQYRGQMLSLV